MPTVLPLWYCFFCRLCPTLPPETAGVWQRSETSACIRHDITSHTCDMRVCACLPCLALPGEGADGTSGQRLLLKWRC